MDAIIIKFGGSSLIDKKSRLNIINTIRSENDRKIIIVVSAPGRLNDPYATDTLLNLIPKLNSQDKDFFISMGEIISCYLLRNDLLEYGIESVIVKNNELGIITDNNFSNAHLLHLEPKHLLELLSKNNILIVPGFQGHTINGETTTLGRSGSDLTAIYLAKMLGIKHVCLYKDVEGVLVVNPKIAVSNTLLPILSYSEMLNISKHNNQVIQHNAVEFALKENIEIYLINYHSNCLGTLISEENSKRRLIGIDITVNSLILIGNFIEEDQKDIIWKLKNSNIEYKKINFSCNEIVIEFEKIDSDYIEIFHNYLA